MYCIHANELYSNLPSGVIKFYTSEVIKWVEANIEEYKFSVLNIDVTLYSDADAVAFKLRWF